MGLLGRMLGTEKERLPLDPASAAAARPARAATASRSSRIGSTTSSSSSRGSGRSTRSSATARRLRDRLVRARRGAQPQAAHEGEGALAGAGQDALRGAPRAYVRCHDEARSRRLVAGKKHVLVTPSPTLERELAASSTASRGVSGAPTPREDGRARSRRLPPPIEPFDLLPEALSRGGGRRSRSGSSRRDAARAAAASRSRTCTSSARARSGSSARASAAGARGGRGLRLHLAHLEGASPSTSSWRTSSSRTASRPRSSTASLRRRLRAPLRGRPPRPPRGEPAPSRVARFEPECLDRAARRAGRRVGRGGRDDRRGRAGHARRAADLLGPRAHRSRPPSSPIATCASACWREGSADTPAADAASAPAPHGRGRDAALRCMAVPRRGQSTTCRSIRDGEIIGVPTSGDVLRSTGAGPIAVLRGIERLASRDSLPGYGRRSADGCPRCSRRARRDGIAASWRG